MNRINSSIFLSFIAALFLLPVGAFGIQTKKQSEISEIRYKCPPCGCRNDITLYSESGECSMCGMKMVMVYPGIKSEIDKIVAPVFNDETLDKFYTKLIYPLFAIGILFSLFVFLTGIRKKSLNLYLSGIILAISLFGFKNQLFGTYYGMTSNYKTLFTPISFILMIGPLIYLYTKDLTESNFRWKRKYWIHFIPAILMLTYYLVLMVMPESVKSRFMFSPFEIFLSHTEQILAVISGFIYIGWATRIFRKWQVSYSQGATQLNSWITRFLIGMTSLFVVWLLVIFINFWLYDFGVATITYNPLWVWLGIILMWMGAEVLLNPKFFLINKPGGVINGSRVINDLELLHYKIKLEDIMSNEKIYSDPELSLDKLASVMKINPRYLSTILNTVLGKSFYDYINFYRIEEVKRLLKIPENKNLTIEGIANLAGFKSKSSFNSAFKKYTGLTPREFIKHELVA